MIVLPPFGRGCANGSRLLRKKQKRSRGKHNTGCTSDTRGWQPKAKIRENRHCRGPRTAGLHLGHRNQSGNKSGAASGRLTKSKNLPRNEKTKATCPMNSNPQLEHRASSSRSKHEGESSFALCDRLSRTRDNSQRQLPTDQDYAASTREYQTDQSSLKTAPTAARSVLEKPRSNDNNPTVGAG
jgi:hypothetical protein